MSKQLILSLLVLAAVDSLNPSIILMTLYLLSTERPEKRTASYIFAVFVTNWTLGLLVYFGLGAVLSTVINEIMYATSWWAYGLQLIAAVALLIAAVMMKTETDPGFERKPKKINPAATFSLGVGLTFLEFSTAAPYLGAISALTKAAPPALVVTTALGLYNIIYVGIPLALFGIFLFKRDQAQTLLARINLHVNRWIKKIMKVTFFILGLLLLADFIGYLLGHSFLVPDN